MNVSEQKSEDTKNITVDIWPAEKQKNKNRKKKQTEDKKRKRELRTIDRSPHVR